MKDNKTIFKINKLIKEEQKKLNEQLVILSERKEQLRNECPHDIVFRLYDNAPRKIGIIYHYYCPACKSVVPLHMNTTLDNSPFEKSKVLILNGLDIMNDEDYEDVFNIIQNEVFENYSYYYNNNNNNERLAKSMSESIKEQRKNYLKVKQKLIKTK